MVLTPLPLADWHFRWLIMGSGARLHRVATADEQLLAEHGWSHGQTLCDYNAPLLVVPGVLTRMHARRCIRCCKLVGIPPGGGAPFNALTGAGRDK